ncbi:hypothetical protein EMIT047CA2_80114 [Pseudomonas soli]
MAQLINLAGTYLMIGQRLLCYLFGIGKPIANCLNAWLFAFN